MAFAGTIQEAIARALPNGAIENGKITLKPAHCTHCGAYNVHTSQNGLITWETPPDDCCKQRAKELIKRFERHAQQIQAREIENETVFEIKRADRIEEFEKFKRTAKADEERRKIYKGNQSNLDYYTELMDFVNGLKRKLNRNEIPDARDVRGQ
jgi:hypothetical protein